MFNAIGNWLFFKMLFASTGRQIYKNFTETEQNELSQPDLC